MGMEKLYNVLIIGEKSGVYASIVNIKKKHPSLPIQHIKYVANQEDCESACQNFEPDIIFINPIIYELMHSECLENCKRGNPDIIFYSNQSEYALQAIKMQAQDFLLEPLQEPEVLYSISRIITRRQVASIQEGQFKQQQSTLQYQEKRIRVVTRDSIEFVLVKEIECLEADGSYSIIYLYNRDKKILISKRLKEILDEIDNERFMRVHNSWIININYVDKFISKDSIVVTKKGKMIPVSRRNKDELLYRISKYFD